MPAIALALTPTRVSYEQLRRDFAAGLDLQDYVATMADLGPAAERGAINWSRTQVVLVADNMPAGAITKAGDTHLAFTLARLLLPDVSSEAPTPVIIIRSSDGIHADRLHSDIRTAMERMHDAGTADAALRERVRVVSDDMMEIHRALSEIVPAYLGAPEPFNRLILDPSVDDLQIGRKVPIISVASAKGGAGKTTNSLMLAFAIARSAAAIDKRCNVVIVELDLARAVMGPLISTKEAPEERPTVMEFVNRAEPTEGAVRMAMSEETALDSAGNALLPDGAIRYILGPRSSSDAANVSAENITQILTLLTHMDDVDLVLVDTSPDLLESTQVIAALQASDLILYVAEDKPTSYAKMGETLETLQDRWGIPADHLKVVINKAKRSREDERLRDDIRDNSAGVAALGVVPMSEFLADYDGAAASGPLWQAFFMPDETPLRTSYNSLVRAALPMAGLPLFDDDTAAEDDKKNKKGKKDKKGWGRK